MIDIDKITDVIGSDEGSALLAEYTRLFLQQNHPDLAHDENAQKMIITLCIQQISEQTVPSGIGYRDYIIRFLKASIENLDDNVGATASYSPITPARELKRSKPLIIAGIITILASAPLTLIDGPTLGSISLVVGIGLLASGLKKKDRS